MSVIAKQGITNLIGLYVSFHEKKKDVFRVVGTFQN